MRADNTFWQYCITQWQQPALQTVLLQASIDNDTDVVGALFCAWCITQSTGIEREAFVRSQQRFLAIIHPLRSARRQSKGVINETIRSELKHSELKIERLYADALFELPLKKQLCAETRDIYLQEMPRKAREILSL